MPGHLEGDKEESKMPRWGRLECMNVKLDTLRNKDC